MKRLIESILERFRAVEKTANAARNLAGDGSRIGVDITPDGCTIRWLASSETEPVRITGAASGGRYPAMIVRWDEGTGTWVDTGQTCEVLAL